jgi:hypothetical protein
VDVIELVELALVPEEVETGFVELKLVLEGVGMGEWVRTVPEEVVVVVEGFWVVVLTVVGEYTLARR